MLAVVIPFYKISSFEQTLQSLAGQTDKRFRVYIGDDCSPFDPQHLVSAYTNQINIIYKRFEENLGATSLTKQWERCIEMVDNEEWVMILGDDDYLDSNVVEAFYKNYSAVQSGRYNLIRYASQVVDKNNQPTSKIFYNPNPQLQKHHLVMKYEGFTRSSLSEHIFRKKSYMQYGFVNYPLAWHSDDMAWLQFTDFGRVFCINNAVVHVQTSENSITGSINNQDLKNTATLQFFTELLTIYREKFTPEEIIKIELAVDLYVYNKNYSIAQIFKKYYNQAGFTSALSFLYKRLKHALTWRVKDAFNSRS